MAIFPTRVYPSSVALRETWEEIVLAGRGSNSGSNMQVIETLSGQMLEQDLAFELDSTDGETVRAFHRARRGVAETFDYYGFDFDESLSGLACGTANGSTRAFPAAASFLRLDRGYPVAYVAAAAKAWGTDFLAGYQNLLAWSEYPNAQATANLLTANQSSVVVDLTGILENTPTGVGTLTRDTSVALFGSASAKLVSSTDDDLYIYASVTPVTAGTPYTFSVWIRCEEAKAAVVYITWYDGTPTAITDTFGSSSTITASTWTRYTVSGVAPVGATQCTCIAKVASVTAGKAMWWDGAQLEAGWYASKWQLGGTSCTLGWSPFWGAAIASLRGYDFAIDGTLRASMVQTSGGSALSKLGQFPDGLSGRQSLAGAAYQVGCWMRNPGSKTVRVRDNAGNYQDVAAGADWTKVSLAGGAQPAPSLTRAGVAYTSDGREVASGAPRFEPGRSGQALLIEKSVTNLLTANQASVETDASGFGGNLGTEALTRSFDYAWHGAASLKVVTPGGAAYEGFYCSYSSASANVTYTLTAWVCGSGTVRISISGNGGTTTVYSSDIVLSSTWQRLTITGVAGATATAINLAITTSTSQAVTFYADGMQIEASNFATSWHPGGVGGRNTEIYTVDISTYLNTLKPHTLSIWGRAPQPNTLINQTFSMFMASYYSTQAWYFGLEDDPSGRKCINYLAAGAAVGGAAYYRPSILLSSDPTGWHHYARTFDGTTVRSYLDGVLFAEVKNTPIAASTLIALGNLHGAYTGRVMLEGFQGWQRCLSAAELLATASSSSPVRRGDSVFTYDFDGSLLPGLSFGTVSAVGDALDFHVADCVAMRADGIVQLDASTQLAVPTEDAQIVADTYGRAQIVFFTAPASGAVTADVRGRKYRTGWRFTRDPLNVRLPEFRGYGLSFGLRGPA